MHARLGDPRYDWYMRSSTLVCVASRSLVGDRKVIIIFFHAMDTWVVTCGCFIQCYNPGQPKSVPRTVPESCFVDVGASIIQTSGGLLRSSSTRQPYTSRGP